MFNSFILAFVGYAFAGPVFPRASNSSAPTSMSNSTGQLLFLPTVHWDHASNDLDNLKPNRTHTIYFTPEGKGTPDEQHAFVQARVTMQKPTVILDHCGTIKTVSCAGNSVSVAFQTKEAFDTAKNYWSNFTIGTNGDDCGQLTHQRSFWDVISLDFSEKDLSVVAAVHEEVDIGSHTSEADATWGVYQPEQSKGENSAQDTPGPLQPRMFLKAVDHVESRTVTLEGGTVAGGAAQVTPGPLQPRFDVIDGITSFAGDFKSRAGDAKSAWGVATSDVRKVAGEVTSFGGDLASEIADGLAGSRTANGHLSLNAKPTAYATAAPWPNAVEINKLKGTVDQFTGDLKAYCVDCHTSGHLDFAGYVSWNVTGPTEAHADLNGKLEAQLNLGLDADVKIKPPALSVVLYNINPEAWVTENFITIGPSLSVSAELDTEIDLKGKVKFDTKMNVDDFKAHIDLIDATQSNQNFKPHFDSSIDAEETIGLTATLALPIELSIGVKIKALDFDESVALVDTPSLTGHIEGSTTKSCLPWDIFVENKLDFQAFKSDFSISDQKEDLFHGCIDVEKVKADRASVEAGMASLLDKVVSAAHATKTSHSSGHGGFASIFHYGQSTTASSASHTLSDNGFFASIFHYGQSATASITTIVTSQTPTAVSTRSKSTDLPKSTSSSAQWGVSY